MNLFGNVRLLLRIETFIEQKCLKCLKCDLLTVLYVSVAKINTVLD